MKRSSGVVGYVGALPAQLESSLDPTDIPGHLDDTMTKHPTCRVGDGS